MRLESLPRWLAMLCMVSATSLLGVAQTYVAMGNRVLVKLMPDPIRSSVYALNKANGTNSGTLLTLNAADGRLVSEVTLGITPTDMTFTPAGDGLYVINTGSRSIMKVDLGTLAVIATRVIGTPNTYDPANPLHILAGKSN